MTKEAKLEAEHYIQWCTNNERPCELRQSVVDYCDYAGLSNDVYAELCDMFDVVDLTSDFDVEPEPLEHPISQDDIDELLGDSRHEFDESTSKDKLSESFGGDKKIISKFMLDHGFDIKGDNEFINDFMMAFGHGPYNYDINDMDMVDDDYLRLV